MEESLSFLQNIKKNFSCDDVDIKTYSPLTLAFLGDCVYDLMIRTIVVNKGNRAANSLHKTTSSYVKAATQSAMIEALMDSLSTEEVAIYKRGRNAKSYTSAKNASIADYRRATGFEALVGYLYLKDDMNRILELVQIGFEKIEMPI